MRTWTWTLIVCTSIFTIALSKPVLAQGFDPPPDMQTASTPADDLLRFEPVSVLSVQNTEARLCNPRGGQLFGPCVAVVDHRGRRLSVAAIIDRTNDQNLARLYRQERRSEQTLLDASADPTREFRRDGLGPSASRNIATALESIGYGTSAISSRMRASTADFCAVRQMVPDRDLQSMLAWAIQRHNARTLGVEVHALRRKSLAPIWTQARAIAVETDAPVFCD